MSDLELWVIRTSENEAHVRGDSTLSDKCAMIRLFSLRKRDLTPRLSRYKLCFFFYVIASESYSRGQNIANAMNDKICEVE